MFRMLFQSELKARCFVRIYVNSETTLTLTFLRVKFASRTFAYEPDKFEMHPEIKTVLRTIYAWSPFATHLYCDDELSRYNIWKGNNPVCFERKILLYKILRFFLTKAQNDRSRSFFYFFIHILIQRQWKLRFPIKDSEFLNGKGIEINGRLNRHKSENKLKSVRGKSSFSIMSIIIA